MNYQIKDESIARDVKIVELAKTYAHTWSDSLINHLWSYVWDYYKDECSERDLNRHLQKKNEDLYWEVVDEELTNNDKYMEVLKSYHDEYHIRMKAKGD